MKLEVLVVVEFLKSITIEYKPQIIYTFIDKMSDHRLFLKSSEEVWNPGPGTVLDTALVEN